LQGRWSWLRGRFSGQIFLLWHPYFLVAAKSLVHKSGVWHHLSGVIAVSKVLNQVSKPQVNQFELLGLNWLKVPLEIVLPLIVSWILLSSSIVLAETVKEYQLPTDHTDQSILKVPENSSAQLAKQRLQNILGDQSPANQLPTKQNDESDQVQKSVAESLELINQLAKISWKPTAAEIAKSRLQAMQRSASTNNNQTNNFGVESKSTQIPQPIPIEQQPPGIIQPNDSAPTLPQPLVPETTDQSPVVPISPAATTPPAVNDPRYLIAPRNVNLDQVLPLSTQVVIDEVPFTHQSQFEITGGVELGNQRSTNPSLTGNALTGATIQESVSKDRVYRVDYRSSYGKVRTVRQQREISTATVAPETALGNRQQISVVADCLPGIANSPINPGQKQTCNYLPSLKNDETAIDPQTLLPTRFLSPSKFGDIVTPESLAAMRAPGFQSGANGQELGLDLYFPLVSTRPGNTQGTGGTVTRFESVTDVPAITAGSIRQVVVTNGQQNALGRTVRGFTYPGSTHNLALNSGVQLLSELLPDIEPTVGMGIKGRPTSISRNLFLAANNNRSPENSFTAYQAGLGRSKTPLDARSLPTANYNSIWVGLSPVISRQAISKTTYQTTGPERVTLSSGGEGAIDSNVSVVTAIGGTDAGLNNLNNFNLTNAYSQAYLTLYERDVNTLNSVVLKENTTYHPHISFAGNVTTANSVLRYYSGAIFNTGYEQQPASLHGYVGGDFTAVGAGGLNYSLAAVGYLNPTPEYYSRIAGTVSQRVKLGQAPGYNLVFSSGINYAIDGNSNLDALKFRSGNSFLNVGATANLGSVSLGASYFIPTGLPNQIDNLLSTNLSWKIIDGVSLSGYYTPVNDNSSRSTIGASAAFRLGKDYNSPTLSLNWNRNEIDFGKGGASRIGYADNVYGIYFRFGTPSNPFSPANR
jgi:hypothetical protein